MDTESLFVHDVMFTIPLGKLRIPVTNTIVMMWIIMVVMIVLALILVRPKKFEKVPKGKQLVAETIVGGIQNILVKNMGKKGKDFTPYFGTILLFLVFANIASIFNIIPSAELVHHWTGWMPKVWFQIEPPTSDLNLPLVLALMTICLIPMSSIKYTGLKGYGKSFLKPTPIMLPFNILDYATRTLSLSLRLFGNIFAGVVIMDMLYAGSVFVKPIVPLASAFFDLFDAGLQAYIFVFLSSIYVSEAINNE
ncbi:MAG: F0F1 ATP synthase subunit A [Acutalibacteraceae bacterium]|nr:F0F1 ATP synthase subunit A [Acutalibacteraceae bacterium]